MPHPYEAFEGSELWRVIDTTVAELEENGDLELTTHRRYVIGYLCKRLTDEQLATARPSDAPAV
jgi:hypothetical protein